MKSKMIYWKNFLVEDIFEIINGKGITNEEIINNPGTLEAVQSGEGNNGVMGLIDKIYCQEKGYSYCDYPCLTVARSGTAGFVSYHPRGCVVGDSAKILLLKDPQVRTSNVYLFLQTLLTANRFKYTYGRKVTEALYRKTVIKLPVTSDGRPDWEWIESYMQSLNSKPLVTGNKSPDSLLGKNLEAWKWFYVDDLFDSIYKVSSYQDSELSPSTLGDKESIAYVTRTDLDNGVKSRVDAAGLLNIEAGNAIVIGDTTSTISYQASPFVAGEHIVAARAKWLNQFTGLFVACLLKRERYRYSYGRAYKLNLIRGTRIKMPVASDGNPDWKFIEGYMKSLPYGDKL